MKTTDLRRISAGGIAAAAAAAILLGCGAARPDAVTTTSPPASPASHLPPRGAPRRPPARTHPRHAPAAPEQAKAPAPSASRRHRKHAEPEQSFLHAVGVAYAGYLSGGAVPDDLSATARRQLGARLGRHVKVRLQGVQLRHDDQAALLMAAGGRRFTVPVTVQLRGARWSVLTIAPPDLDQLEAPPPAPPAEPPAAAREPIASARAFLAGYLRLLNGRGSAAQLHNSTPRLRAELGARPVAVPNDGTLRLAHLGIAGAGPTWTAEPLITNGQTTFELKLTIEKAATRRCASHPCHLPRQWVVSAIRSPGR